MTRELVGEIADGWTPVAVESPTILAKHIADVEKGAKKSGRTLEDIDIAITVYTDVIQDVEIAYQQVAPVAKSMLIQQREVLEELSGIKVPKELSLQQLDPTNLKVAEKIKEIAESILRRIVEEIVAIGSPDDCIDKLEKFLNAGATSIIVCNLSKQQDRVFKIYVEKIMTYLKSQYGTNE